MSEAERLRRAEEIFHDLLALPEAERPTHLRELCASDDPLRRLVESLLAHHADTRISGGSPPVDAMASTISAPSRGDDPLQIGPYYLLRKLGEGGMGEVWEAEQSEPLRRRVAIKLIRQGLDSAQVVNRFAAERQALALMRHPNIAQVFDGGTTDNNRPYVVMELVQGKPLVAYCDEHLLDLTARIELFRQVCAGVQHAHQKGIIHRDLKPTNILVTVVDGVPTPKIIDFGLAKAIGQPLSERILFTEMGQLIGTPEYMSPEQADGSSLDLDTRTDVYALGIVLYELLAGVLPFEPAKLRKAGLQEILRRIREDEAPKPSTRLSSLGADLDQIAHRRHTHRGTLLRQLRGELDWIVLRCIEKDRSRRYASVQALMDDLQRYFRNEPLEAGPPSTLYRSRKFLRRHRVGASFAALSVVFLVGIATLSIVQSGRVAAERDRATQEAASAARVADFLVDLFRGADPGRSGGEHVSARELLDRGASQALAGLEKDPGIRARLAATAGEIYQELGVYDEAEPYVTMALEESRNAYGPGSIEVIAALRRLGQLQANQRHFEEARETLNAARDMLEQLPDPDELEGAHFAAELGGIAFSMSSYAEAESLFQSADAVYEAELGRDHRVTMQNLRALAETYHWRVRSYELPEDDMRADETYLDLLERQRRVLGSGHPDINATLNGLASCYATLRGRPEEAIVLQEEAVAGDRRALGEGHERVSTGLSSLGVSYRQAGNLEKAEALYLEALALQEEHLGRDHQNVAATMTNLAMLYADQGRFAEALPYVRRSREIRTAVLGADHHRIAEALWYEGMLLGAMGQPDEALGEYEAAIAIVRGNQLASPGFLAHVLGFYGETLRELGRESDALAALNEKEELEAALNAGAESR